MRRLRLVLPLGFLIGSLCATIAPARTSAAETETNAEFFEQTGHGVRGNFLRYWRQHGGLSIFGYPISAAFQQDGRETQYFERAVFQSFPQQIGRAHV